MSTGPPTTPMELLERLSAVAGSDVADYLEIRPDGSLRLELRRAEESGTLWLIRRLRVERGGFSLELFDNSLALYLLLRFHKLMEDRTAARGPIDFPAGIAIPDVSRPASRRKPSAVA